MIYDRVPPSLLFDLLRRPRLTHGTTNSYKGMAQTSAAASSARNLTPQPTGFSQIHSRGGGEGGGQAMSVLLSWHEKVWPSTLSFPYAANNGAVTTTTTTTTSFLSSFLPFSLSPILPSPFLPFSHSPFLPFSLSHFLPPFLHPSSLPPFQLRR